MEEGKNVQDKGRGIIFFKGKAYARNMENQPRMHKLIAADLASKGISLGQLNYSNFRIDELASQTERSVDARRNIER